MGQLAFPFFIFLLLDDIINFLTQHMLTIKYTIFCTQKEKKDLTCFLSSKINIANFRDKVYVLVSWNLHGLYFVVLSLLGQK